MSVNIAVEVEKKVKAIDKEMKHRSAKATRALKNAELRVMRGARGGASYSKPFRRSSYTASAPGEPPAVRTGNLRNSLMSSVETEDNGFLSLTVKTKTDVHYAGYLEHGTSKMAARPYVDKIKKEALPELKTIYGAAYNV